MSLQNYAEKHVRFWIIQVLDDLNQPSLGLALGCRWFHLLSTGLVVGVPEDELGRKAELFCVGFHKKPASLQVFH